MYSLLPYGNLHIKKVRILTIYTFIPISKSLCTYQFINLRTIIKMNQVLRNNFFRVNCVVKLSLRYKEMDFGIYNLIFNF